MECKRGISISGFEQFLEAVDADLVNGDWEWRGFDRAHGSAFYGRDRLWLYISIDRRWRMSWSQAKDARQARDEKGDIGIVRSCVMDELLPPWEAHGWEQNSGSQWVQFTSFIYPLKDPYGGKRTRLQRCVDMDEGVASPSADLSNTPLSELSAADTVEPMSPVPCPRWKEHKWRRLPRWYNRLTRLMR